MKKKLVSLLCAFALILSVSAFAPALAEGERYVGEAKPGASALYVAGKQVTLDDAYFYGAGTATDQEITDQIPNQFGLCSVVLAAGLDTDVTLNNPTIESDPDSYANGVFAAAMAKVTVNGGTIDTDNSNGHGIDATYMAHVYASDTVIHTRGETSGALATDFGGGFISGERLVCQTEGGSSPGIFCAGSTVMLLKDCQFITQKATGIVVAHDHAAVVLDHCDVNAAGDAVSGLQALPSAAASDGSVFYAFGGRLASQNGAVVGESGGRTVVNLIGVECFSGKDAAISVSSRSAGILTVNLWDTALTGSIECGEGSSLTVNVYAGGSLTGDVTGDGEIVINVYEGGAYDGSFAVNDCDAGESAPVLGSFDDYLVNCWASGSMTWTEARAKEYVNSVEPQILENSAVRLVEDGAAAKPYDPQSFNPSETGVDLSLLNVGGAHGFTVGEVFGGQQADGASDGASGGMPGGAADGESDGNSNGGSAGGSSGTPGDTTEERPEEKPEEKTEEKDEEKSQEQQDGASSGMPGGDPNGTSSGMPAGGQDGASDGASSGAPAGDQDGASSGMPSGMPEGMTPPEGGSNGGSSGKRPKGSWAPGPWAAGTLTAWRATTTPTTPRCSSTKTA